MTVEEPTAPRGSTGTGADSVTDQNDQPVSTLRGAGVDVDVHRAGQVVIGVCLVALAVTAVVLLVAGFQKNAQINNLRRNGVPVNVKVTSCLGLMGGSGSNLAGYACSGTYVVDGHRYARSIPGSRTFYPTGSTVRGVTTPGDPALLSLPAIVSSERASWRVFIVPVVLLVVLALAAAAILLRRRRHRRTVDGPASS